MVADFWGRKEGTWAGGQEGKTRRKQNWSAPRGGEETEWPGRGSDTSLGTVTPRSSLASALAKPCTHHVLMRKTCFGTFGTCSGLIVLARTCMSQHAAPQEKTRHRSELVGFSTCPKFQTELTSTEVPPRTFLCRFGFWKHVNILYSQYKLKSTRMEQKLNWKQTETNEQNCISNLITRKPGTHPNWKPHGRGKEIS